MLRRLAVLFCAAALLYVVPAGADQWNKKTTVTFNRSIELPGIVLPAGTYVFRLLDEGGANRHVVQVFNAEETHLFTTILAIPNYRLKPTGETVMRFTEPIRGTPEAMKAWFYPADNFGQEFVYPKKRATELAAVTKTPVLAGEIKPAETPAELAKEPVVAVTPESEEVPAPTVVEAPPAEAPPVIAEARPAPAPEPQAAAAAAPATLPKTASPYPALLLIGIGSLAAAGGLRAVARRVV